MDYKQLLIKYMKNVIDNETVAYLEDWQIDDADFTIAEIDELREIYKALNPIPE